MAPLDDAALDAMIAEATVDCYDPDECTTGFLTLLDERLVVPFTTAVLGVEVTVTGIDVTGDGGLAATCQRGGARQRIALLDLPLPTPLPEGAEWVEAYRRWLRTSHG